MNGKTKHHLYNGFVDPNYDITKQDLEVKHSMGVMSKKSIIVF
jgi:hypothetical protein